MELTKLIFFLVFPENYSAAKEDILWKANLILLNSSGVWPNSTNRAENSELGNKKNTTYSQNRSLQNIQFSTI